ncbi:histidine phosphatase family protein [Halobacteriales archaeon SW_7_68_16]|nr:MAG: histidine phosphatase family protein [Halobacteriales archaeon SW_7_68_16]
MTVLLVRHGETTWNVEERIQGWAGAPLSGRGREQARATGSYLADVGVDRLVVSDLQRTQETAHLVAEGGLDTDPSYERGWRERDFGDVQGLDHAVAAERFSDHDPDASLTAVEDVPGAAVVTHGGPIRAVVAAVTNRPMADLAREWSPANCGVTELDVAGEPRLVRRNDTGHL